MLGGTVFFSGKVIKKDYTWDEVVLFFQLSCLFPQGGDEAADAGMRGEWVRAWQSESRNAGKCTVMVLQSGFISGWAWKFHINL